MNSKIFKITALSLLPLFILMLDIVNGVNTNSSTESIYIVQNLTVIYVIYAFLVSLLEDLKVLYHEEKNLLHTVIYSTTDMIILTSLLLATVGYKKIWLIAYVVIFLLEILQSGKIALLENSGEKTYVKYEKLIKYSGYIGLVLIFLIPNFFGITTIFILPYILLKAISTYELFLKK